MARINLIPDPSFRHGVTNWTGVNGATVSSSTTQKFIGAYSMAVVKSGVNNSGATTVSPITVLPNKPYSLSTYVSMPTTNTFSGSSGIVLKVQWYNSIGVLITETPSTIVDIPVSVGDWTRITSVVASPSTAATAKILLTQLVSGPDGDILFADGFLLEQSAFIGGFLDNITQASETSIVNRALTLPTYAGPEGMKLNADVSIGDLVLNTIDEDGTLWVCTDIDGWWGPSEPEIADIPRGVEDGSYEVSGRYKPRIMSLEGVMIPGTPEGIEAARDKLVSAINLVRHGAWLRTNAEPTRAAHVTLQGKPDMPTKNARGRIDFVVGLRSADPIKYEWNDAAIDGVTTVTILGSAGSGNVVNVGTADVTASLVLTGPLGIGSSVTNTRTDETITLVKPLRGSNSVAAVITKELFNGVVTMTTSAPHSLVVGDVIKISDCGAPYDSINEVFVVIAASDSLPYSFSYVRQSPDRTAIPANGSVQLAFDDVLEIDTYDRSVTLNGNFLGHRSHVKTLIDWIKIAPGDNQFVLDDSLDDMKINNKALLGNVVTLTTDVAHFLDLGDSITVTLPETAQIRLKSLTSNVVTLTTIEDHGFSEGDSIDVVSTVVSTVTNKELTSNVVTLTTLTDGGFVSGDSITVDLPTVAGISAKSLTSNVATITSPTAHGFSTGDSVVVSLPTSANISNKALVSNTVTLTTDTTHNYSVGDSILVTLPTTATIVNKATAGLLTILTASAVHSFSVGDQVIVAFPTAATPASNRSMAGSPTFLASISTAAAHGFSVGDSITVNINMPSTMTVTNRLATTTSCTLTTSVVNNFSVGEKITVAGVGSRYNGTFYISAVNNSARTLTYLFDGASESVVSATGTVSNLTISSGYNGTKIIEAVTPTTVQYYVESQAVASSSSMFGSGPTIVNNTNTSLNGTFPITSVPTSTQFSYTRTV